MADEDRTWLEEITMKMTMLENDGRKKLEKAVQDAIDYPNVITVLQNSTTINLESILDFNNHKLQYDAVLLEILNHTRSLASQNQLDRPLNFFRTRIPETIPKKYNINKENYQNYCTQSSKPIDHPSDKEMSTKVGDKFKCTFKNCRKQYGSHKATIRHAKNIHYFPKKIMCDICHKYFSRPNIFVIHAQKMHNQK